MQSAELLAGIGSVLGFILGLLSMYLSNHETITLWMNKIQALFSSYIQITIPEYGAEHLERSAFYVAIEAYLSKNCGTGVRKLKAELGRHTKIPLFSVDDGQQIVDTFCRRDGISFKIWWHAYKEKAAANVNYRPGQEERRFYRVSFHRRFHKLVDKEYLPYVIEQGRDNIAMNRQLRLFTNNSDSSWSSVAFQHPATFCTLAMDHARKKEVIDDLNAFMKGKDYYAKVGKPWKRGYLLYGPPGTGKSTMVSAMANHLYYDVYDLELTAVRSNNDLGRLFIETTEKSIIVVEDIDRSVDLAAGKRVVNMQQPPATTTTTEKKGIQQLTLSGLLNFMDGLWSACGGERIIVFTTNNIDKLDPALIRPGRMDKQIEMSYCTYEGFKVLAGNYLDLGIINGDDLFVRYGEIQHLLEVAKITPADVAEHLMRTEKHVGACLDDLVQTLKSRLKAKEKAEASKKEGQHDQEE